MQDYGSNALAAAMTFAVAVGGLSWLGATVDGWLGTRVLFLIVGFLLGAAGGGLHLVHKLAPDMLRRRPPVDRDDGGGQP